MLVRDSIARIRALPGVMAAAFSLARLMASFLWGVETTDPVVFITVPVLLSAVALFAMWFPARRAIRTDPVEALRQK